VLEELSPRAPGLEDLPADVCPPPRLRLDPVSAKQERSTPARSKQKLPHNAHLATLVRNERVTPIDHFQDTRHFEFELEDEVEYVCRHVAF
jgi:sulfite reductase alpha subunit-like flavoprotein